MSTTEDPDLARAQSLIRIGEQGIAHEDDTALESYFSKSFTFHGPVGDLTLSDLKVFWAAMRSAFREFRVDRPAILVKGDLVAARTTMTGIFHAPFEMPPFGSIAPTGGPINLELINLFRYDSDGRLAEEWAQYDNLGFLRQLGVDLVQKALG